MIDLTECFHRESIRNVASYYIIDSKDNSIAVLFFRYDSWSTSRVWTAQWGCSPQSPWGFTQTASPSEPKEVKQ